MFISFGLELLPSAALRIAVGLLTAHVVLVGLSKHRGRSVTWIPVAGSLGVFLFFVMWWGMTMKINEGIGSRSPNSGLLCVDLGIATIARRKPKKELAASQL